MDTYIKQYIKERSNLRKSAPKFYDDSLISITTFYLLNNQIQANYKYIKASYKQLLLTPLFKNDEINNFICAVELATCENTKHLISKYITIYQYLKDDYDFSLQRNYLTHLLVQTSTFEDYYDIIKNITNQRVLFNEKSNLSKDDNWIHNYLLYYFNKDFSMSNYNHIFNYTNLKIKNILISDMIATIMSIQNNTILIYVDKFLDLLSMFEKKSILYNDNEQLAILFILSQKIDNDILFKKLIDIDGKLNFQKGYGMFGMTNQDRLIHSAIILAQYLEIDPDLIRVALIFATISEFQLSVEDTLQFSNKIIVDNNLNTL